MADEKEKKKKKGYLETLYEDAAASGVLGTKAKIALGENKKKRK